MTLTNTGDSVLTDATIEAIAEEACSHARTVERRLLRLPVKGRVADRVDAALVRRGLIYGVVSAPTCSDDRASR